MLDLETRGKGSSWRGRVGGVRAEAVQSCREVLLTLNELEFRYGGFVCIGKSRYAGVTESKRCIEYR